MHKEKFMVEEYREMYDPKSQQYGDKGIGKNVVCWSTA